MWRCRTTRPPVLAPLHRGQRLRSLAARPHSTGHQLPPAVKLSSKFGRSEILPAPLQENGFSLWSSFLDSKEHDKFVNGLLNAKIRAEQVDESMGTFKRFREPFDEMIELMEKIEDSGLLKGVRRSDENMGVFWVDDIEPMQRVEPTFELPGTGDRAFIVNFFSPVVISLFQEEASHAATRILMEPGGLLALTGAAKVSWIRHHEQEGTWNGKHLPPRRRFEFKLIPSFDRQFMQEMVDKADGATQSSS